MRMSTTWSFRPISLAYILTVSSHDWLKLFSQAGLHESLKSVELIKEHFGFNMLQELAIWFKRLST